MVPWGQEAFSAYLGADQKKWKEYDACDLVKSGASRFPLLVDQGAGDEYLKLQLRPTLLRESCESAKHPLELRIRADFDHSYYFIASFIDEHIAYHAKALN